MNKETVVFLIVSGLLILGIAIMVFGMGLLVYNVSYPHTYSNSGGPDVKMYIYEKGDIVFNTTNLTGAYTLTGAEE